MAKYEIKIEATGAQQSATEIKKVNDALAGTTKATTAAGAETEKFTSKKRGLVDALKKLKQEIPGVGALVDSLKNPYAAITIAISTAIAATRAYTQAIKEQAQEQAGLEALNGLTLTFFTNTAKARVEAEAFRTAIAAIGTEAKSAAQYLKEANAETAKMFPEGGRGKDVADVTNLGNARRRAADDAAQAEAQLPAAEETLKVATEKLQLEQRNAILAGATGPKQREKAVAELSVVSERLLDPIITKGPSGRVVFDSRTGDKIRQQELLDKISGIDRGADARTAILETLEGDVAAARSRVGGLRKRVESGKASAVQFGLDEKAAAALADQGLQRAPGTGIGRGSLQFRYDAQVAAGGERIKDFELQQVTQALGRLSNAIIKMADDTERKMKNQSQTIQ